MAAKLFYRIRVSGTLGPRWAVWFGGMDLKAEEDGHTAISGPVSDQAALHGVLARIRDLNLTLVSVVLEGDARRTGIPNEETKSEGKRGTTND